MADEQARYSGEAEGPSAQRYSELERFRQPFLDRARECSELTLPALIPPDGWTGQTKLYTPFQSVGARGVNNLSSKLLLALFPANSPFFRYRVDEYAVDKMEQEENLKTKIETGLAKMEKSIVTEIETTAARVPFFEGIKHLLVGGNILLYLAPTGETRVFHLHRYVVKRDPMGNVLEIITKEDVSPTSLPKMIREFLEQYQKDDYKGDDKTCALYTHIYRSEGSWKIHQEIKGHMIPDSRGTYPLDKSPWLPLRFTRIDGEDYGRGFIEEYLGDLKSLEGLAQAIVEGSAAMAKLLILVNPNGTTKKDDLEKAPNGAVRSGNAADVTVVQMQKHADFQVTGNTAANIEQRLSMAFLLTSAIQRDAERVTAEEMRLMAKELDEALGGIYTILSVDFQLPVVKVYQHRMQKQGRLPQLPKGIVRPSITTGIEALGRGNDVSRLGGFLKDAAATVGPEALVQYLVVGEFLERLATGYAIETKGLIRTEQQIAEAAQAQQRQAMLSQFGPEGMKIIGDLMKEKMKAGGSVSDVAKEMQTGVSAQPQQ